MFKEVKKIRLAYLFHSLKKDTFEKLVELVDGFDQLGIKIISPDAYVNSLFINESALITFDDGFEFRDKRIVEFLRNRRIKAISFIPLLTKNLSTYRTNWSYWKENLDVFEIGSHSTSHSKVIIGSTNEKCTDENIIGYNNFNGKCDYALTSREWLPLKGRFESNEEHTERLYVEIGLSKQIIERNIGLECRYFAYPWGQYDDKVKRYVVTSGYVAAFSVNKTDNDRFTIPRIQIT
jgi:peptidoglycan/xylan/chitin deacetylase (PgdA/CDA1 family)